MKFFKYIRRNYRAILRDIFFILTSLIIVYLFPKEGKFRYEFQLNKPWMHENLIAPYDFPIYKLDNELKAERDSLLETFKPYYKYDSTALHEEIRHLERNYKRAWDSYTQRYDSLINERQKSPQWRNYVRFDQKSYDKYLLYISNVLERIYKTGIVEFTEEAPDEQTIMVITSPNIAEEHAYQEIFTLKSAYQFLVEQVKGSVDAPKIESTDKRYRATEYDFIQQLNLNSYIRPNVHYDALTTAKKKESLLNSISLTEGLVQSGQGVILKGELVDRDAYRKLESLRREYESSLGASSNYYLVFIGQIVLVLISMLVLYLFLYNFRRDILNDIPKVSLILVLMLLLILTARLASHYQSINLYLVPFPVLPIIIRIFFDSRMAHMVNAVLLLIVGFIVANSFEFIFTQYIVGTIAIYSLRNLYRRSQLFASVGIVFVCYTLIYFGISAIQEADLKRIDWNNILWFAGNSLLILSSYPLVFIFEKLFGMVSDFTLIELTDFNHPLLRKLASEAPGTFQHSVQVSNLAVEAAHKVGGDTLLIRAGALYHDVGKMEMPFYFIENQSHEINPHNHIEPEKSAEIIINHVTRGIEIAHKHKLPDSVINFIRTHHGTTLVRYFYHTYKEKHPDQEIDERLFRYPGQAPFNRELAMVMMADSVEAASRSLKTITPETIDNLVDSIIEYQIEENQFDNANITFKDISQIKAILKAKLKNIYHARIEYPE